MPLQDVAIQRPQRWDEPFGQGMDADVVERLLGVAPFRHMDRAAFPATLPLEGLLANDCRLVHFQPGDLVIREGDYGSSAFLVLRGVARVALERLAVVEPPRGSRLGSLGRAVARLWPSATVREARGPARGAPYGPGVAARPEGRGAAIFLQDVPRVLDATRTATLTEGEVFGELGALTRSPRSATVFAERELLLLEVRWQGLRDLMRYAPALRDHVHELYRKNSLRVHLRETPLLGRLSAEQLERVALATRFESHGNFDWHEGLDGDRPEDLFDRVTREPLVAEEGSPPTGLLLIRSGFARVSRRLGDGHQTVAYLGKGAVFGAAELARGELEGGTPALEHSLRAVGYLDVICIPAEVARPVVLGSLPRGELLALSQGPRAADAPPLPTPALDFLVDRRLSNGLQAMVINLDRCTRCDDCVRACAATHGGNPRFVRQGPILDTLQFAGACMHCVDPVCLIGCPTGAIHRDPATGVVRINDPTCVGCATCANSCPYHNIRMVETRTPRGALLVDPSGAPIVKATKCDLCSENLGGPACQNACPHDALMRINLSTPLPLAEWAGPAL